MDPTTKRHLSLGSLFIAWIKSLKTIFLCDYAISWYTMFRYFFNIKINFQDDHLDIKRIFVI